MCLCILGNAVYVCRFDVICMSTFVVIGEQVVDPRRRKDKDTYVFERRNRGSLGGTTAAMRAMGLEDVPRS